jgi:hypothetical protein
LSSVVSGGAGCNSVDNKSSTSASVFTGKLDCGMLPMLISAIERDDVSNAA